MIILFCACEHCCHVEQAYDPIGLLIVLGGAIFVNSRQDFLNIE